MFLFAFVFGWMANSYHKKWCIAFHKASLKTKQEMLK